MYGAIAAWNKGSSASLGGRGYREVCWEGNVTAAEQGRMHRSWPDQKGWENGWCRDPETWVKATHRKTWEMKLTRRQVYSHEGLGVQTLPWKPQKTSEEIRLDDWLRFLFSKQVFFFFLINLFNWRLITLQFCGGFCYTLIWISHRCTCVPHPELPSHLLPHPIPLGCPSALALSALFHALKLDWWSLSLMVIYMLQCYSFKSSHSRLLPQSSKVYSFYLCLFCCLVYRVIQSKLSSCNLENQLKQKCPDLEQEAQYEGNWSNSGKKWWGYKLNQWQ